MLRVEGRSKVAYGALSALLDAIAADDDIGRRLDGYATSFRVRTRDAGSRSTRFYTAAYSGNFQSSLSTAMRTIAFWAARYGEGIETDPEEGDSTIREFVVMVGPLFKRKPKKRKRAAKAKR